MATCKLCKATVNGDWGWLLEHLRDHFRELGALFYEIPDKSVLRAILDKWFEGSWNQIEEPVK